MNLSEILNIDYPVSGLTVSRLTSVAREIRVCKKHLLVEQGRKTDSIFFITDGLFRAVHMRDGSEETLLFATTGDPFTSIHSMSAGEPAAFSWQALEDSEVLAVSFSDFDELLRIDNDLHWWLSKALLDQLYVLERRYVWIGNTNATQRYETLLRIRPGIIHKIPVKYIAQYLSIKPETLSRIRARFARK